MLKLNVYCIGFKIFDEQLQQNEGKFKAQAKTCFATNIGRKMVNKP